MRRVVPFLALALIVAAPAVRSQAPKTLDIYFIDVEGGQSTLYVAPSGESMLVDTGSPGPDARDPGRILAVVKQAGLKQIDYLVTSHFHIDHAGGAPAVAAKVPIRNFVDHGPSQEQGKNAAALFQRYTDARGESRHIEVRPGDKVPVRGIDVQVVSAGGRLIKAPLSGGGAPNPLCRAFVPQEDTGVAKDGEGNSYMKGENAASVGMVIRFGRFSMLNLGDLTWNTEHDLVCPNNLLGSVDVYLTTHHGVNLSGPPVLVHAVRPRVAVWNNSPSKGSREPWTTIRTSPGLEDLWQLHYLVPRPLSPILKETSEPGGKDNNVADQFIANLEGRELPKLTGMGQALHDGPNANAIRISARPDGSFTVTNGRTGFSKDYKAVPQRSAR